MKRRGEIKNIEERGGEEMNTEYYEDKRKEGKVNQKSEKIEQMKNKMGGGGEGWCAGGHRR